MRWWALSLVVALLLAGCGGKDSGVNKVRLGDGNLVSLDLREDQMPTKDDIYGAVSGLIVNDAIYPVDGASILIKGLERNATSDANGRFVFEDVVPGLWVLVVNKEGHYEGLGTINVKSADVAKAVVQVKRLPYVAPYHQTVEFQEFSSLANRVLEGDRQHVVGLDGSLKTIILEAVWDPIVVPVGDPLSYAVASLGGEPTEVSGSSAIPMRVQLDPGAFPRDAYALNVGVRPADHAAPPDSSGRIFVTTFYIEPAPEGWSFVGGDT